MCLHDMDAYMRLVSSPSTTTPAYAFDDAEVTRLTSADMTRSNPTEPTCSKEAHEFNVICGRGLKVLNHIGNQRFREVVQQHRERYSLAQSKMQKSYVVNDILASICSAGGNFVSYNSRSNAFEKVSERRAREKIGQGLRDVLHSTYRSSSLAKRKRLASQRQRERGMIETIVRAHERVQTIVQQLQHMLKVESLADYQVESMFTAASSKILEELKSSKCVEIFEQAKKRSSK